MGRRRKLGARFCYRMYCTFGYHIFPSYIYTHSPNQPIFGYCRQQKLRDARTTRVQILTSFFFPSRLDSIQMKYGDTYPSWHQNSYPRLNFYHVRTLWSSLGRDAYCMRLKPSPSRCSDVFPLFFSHMAGAAGTGLACILLLSVCHLAACCCTVWYHARYSTSLDLVFVIILGDFIISSVNERSVLLFLSGCLLLITKMILFLQS